MNIIRQEYDDIKRILYIEFQTKNDEETFYRSVGLTSRDVIYYSPNIINESDLYEMEDDQLIEILYEYFKENDLPNQLYL